MYFFRALVLLYVLTVLVPLIVYGVAFIPVAPLPRHAATTVRPYASAAVWTGAASGGFGGDGSDWMGAEDGQALLGGTMPTAAAPSTGAALSKERGVGREARGFVSSRSSTMDRPPVRLESRHETHQIPFQGTSNQHHIQDKVDVVGLRVEQSTTSGNHTTEVETPASSFESSAISFGLARDWDGVMTTVEQARAEGLRISRRMRRLYLRACARLGHGSRAASALAWPLKAPSMSTLAAVEEGEGEEDLDLALEACAGGAEADVALDIIRRSTSRGGGHTVTVENGAGDEDENAGGEGQGRRGPSVRGLASAVWACARAGRVEEGLMLLHRLERHHTEKKEGGEGHGTQEGEGQALARALYGPLIAACAGAKGEAAANTALLLLRRMEELELCPQRQVYMDVLAACEHAGFWEAALRCLDGMEQRGQGLDLKAFNHALAATCRGGAWERGVELLRRLEAHSHLSPDTHTYAVILTALNKAGEWRAALRLLEVARERQGQDEVDLTLLKAAVDICIRQGRAMEGLGVVLERCKRQGAKGKGKGQEEEDHLLLALALRAATRVKRGRCPEAEALVSDLVSRGPSAVGPLPHGAYASLIHLLDEDGHVQLAKQWLQHACQQGAFSAFSASRAPVAPSPTTSLAMVVDMRGLPLGVARTALRIVLDDIAAAWAQWAPPHPPPSPRPLVLITGPGAYLREGLMTFLQHGLCPLHPLRCGPMPLNPGRLLLPPTELAAYLQTLDQPPSRTPA